jgi:hypothetical protein
VKPYRDEKEVVAMRNLIQAFHDDDVKTFERILKVHIHLHPHRSTCI